MWSNSTSYPTRYGQTWSRKESQALIKELRCDDLTIEEIAVRHQRTVGSIVCQQNKLESEGELCSRTYHSDRETRYYEVKDVIRERREELVKEMAEIKIKQSAMEKRLEDIHRMLSSTS